MVSCMLSSSYWQICHEQLGSLKKDKWNKHQVVSVKIQRISKENRPWGIFCLFVRVLFEKVLFWFGSFFLVCLYRVFPSAIPDIGSKFVTYMGKARVLKKQSSKKQLFWHTWPTGGPYQICQRLNQGPGTFQASPDADFANGAKILLEIIFGLKQDTFIKQHLQMSKLVPGDLWCADF